jgi:exopolyphosphatase/guanosine-5'-triphosphate,3'-diphosphate pyrophosphatase
MKCASIDVGTNTVLLLVAEVYNGFRDLFDTSRITRLGEGLRETGYLTEEAMVRTYAALEDYTRIAGEFGATEMHCVGTAALREAGNAEVFLRRVREGLGIEIRVITGEDEAYFTYLSVRHDLLGIAGDDNLLIVDIGGGSTEIILGEKGRFAGFSSLPLGSVKLTEMFVTHDPPLDEELARLSAHVRQAIPAAAKQGPRLVGTGGTVTNIAGMFLGLDRYDKTRVHGLRIVAGDVVAIVEKLRRMRVSERGTVKGLERGREDIILQGIILLREIMDCYGVEELTVSANGVRYGVLYEKYMETSR